MIDWTFVHVERIHLVWVVLAIVSQLAVLELRSRGAMLIDCQVMSPHMEALGAREIPRGRFLDHLAEMQARGIRLF